MNRKFLIPVASFVLMLCSGGFTANAAATADNDNFKVVRADRDRLPANVRTFIDRHFGANSIVEVEKEDGKFEVELRDGTELKFGRNGRCREIEAGRNKVIAWKTVNQLLPGKARTAIAKRKLRNNVRSISIEEGEIEIEFRGSKFEEIKFDRNGNILDKDRHDKEDRKEWKESRKHKDRDDD